MSTEVNQLPDATDVALANLIAAATDAVEAKDDADDATDPGFEVINPGTPEVAFRITSASLISNLVDKDILGYEDMPRDNWDDARKLAWRTGALSVFSLAERLMNARNRGIDALKKVVTNQLKKPGAHAFYAAVQEQMDIQKARIDEKVAATDSLGYFELSQALVPGAVIVIEHESVKHGAEVVSVTPQVHWAVGPYLDIKLRIVLAKAEGYEYGELNHYVTNYQEDKTLASLGISLMDDTKRTHYLARGKHYVELTSKPSYIQLNGTVVRRSWYGSRSFRANGRAMVDGKSMAMMDPNYGEHYGGGDRYGREESNETKLDMTADRNLLITSPYVYGFSFAAKVWGEMIAEQISTINFRTDAFDKLVLDARYKRVIRALVSTNQGSDSGDIIDGKGGGLTFLLHGTPGIGKTLTAEAIAETLGIPLYSVSTGELGTDPDTLDERLKNILDMASNWGAILLIDEADIFLERRAEGDVHRNAMVGIFLKLLEYYQGILFLTTNRVKNIDTAFYSRISMGIHYPDLDNEKRVTIWTNLLAYAGEHSITKDMIYGLANADLNGRQIKHIIRQASTLARSENRKMGNADIADIMELAREFSELLKSE